MTLLVAKSVEFVKFRGTLKCFCNFSQKQTVNIKAEIWSYQYFIESTSVPVHLDAKHIINKNIVNMLFSINHFLQYCSNCATKTNYPTAYHLFLIKKWVAQIKSVGSNTGSNTSFFAVQCRRRISIFLLTHQLHTHKISHLLFFLNHYA